MAVWVSTIGRDGALTRYEIDGDTTAEIDAVDLLVGSITKYNRSRALCSDGTNAIFGSCNKRQFRQLEELCERANAPVRQQATRPTSPSPTRRVVVETGTVGVGDIVNGSAITGLGTSWRPSDMQIDQFQLNPWVDSVQYAYFG